MVELGGSPQHRPAEAGGAASHSGEAPKSAWHQAEKAREEEAHEAMQVMLSCARSRGAKALLEQGWRSQSWPEAAGGHMISSWHSVDKRLRTKQEVQVVQQHNSEELPKGDDP